MLNWLSRLCGGLPLCSSLRNPVEEGIQLRTRLGRKAMVPLVYIFKALELDASRNALISWCSEVKLVTFVFQSFD